MTEVLRSPSHLPSSPALSCNSNDGVGEHLSPYNAIVGEEEEEEVEDSSVERKQERQRRRGSSGGSSSGGGEIGEQDDISLLEFLLTVLRKSLLGCRTEESEEKLGKSMEIGWPTEVRHIAHVTFDRFHGFLGLPVEFEPEIPRRVPSASTTVFGVSTDSMQCDYDSRGNSVPTILLLMQRHFYEQGGLRVEGIFRITAENSQEEYVRDQLNNGIVPEGIDVHCLAGLIKAWFRELPSGLLDTLSSDQMMQCQTEDDCVELARLLPPTEAALLDWAVNLMADVVQEEEHNKMNARNVATVFAPNMTQMVDPLTALMYAVQVMNFLRMLILKTVKGRQDSILADGAVPSKDPSDENDHQSSKLPLEDFSEESTEQDFVPEKPALNSATRTPEEKSEGADDRVQTSQANTVPEGTMACPSEYCENTAHAEGSTSILEFSTKGTNAFHVHPRRVKLSRTNSQNHRKGRKSKANSTARVLLPAEKSKGTSIVSRINSNAERVEAWR